MSTAIHIACDDCKEHHCIGQMARGELGAPDWVNIYNGFDDEELNQLSRFVTKHLDHGVRILRDEVVFDAMYTEFEGRP